MAESIGGDPAAARLDALKRVAELAENRAGDDQQAMGFWRQVIQTEPDDEEAIEALLRLYPKVNKWREYGALLKGVLDQTSPSDVGRRQELIELLIPVASKHMRQDQLVIELYQELLEIEPDNADAREQLSLRYEKARNWPGINLFLA